MEQGRKVLALDRNVHKPAMGPEGPIYDDKKKNIMIYDISDNSAFWLDIASNKQFLASFNIIGAESTQPVKLNPSHQKVVTDQEGNIMSSNGKIVIWDETEQSQFEVDLTPEVLELFGLSVAGDNQEGNMANEACTEAASSAASNTDCDDSAHWKGRDDAVRQLIHQWDVNAPLFRSTSIKNDAVWAKIAARMVEKNPCWKFTWQQCRDKIKYVRKEYTKVKDWNKLSGNSPKTCKFFEEMEDILGDKPCVKPVSVVSSLKRSATSSGTSSPNDLCDDDKSSDTESEAAEKKPKSEKGPKKKKTKVQKEIESWTLSMRDDANEREKARAERFERGLKVYESTMQKLIDKL